MFNVERFEVGYLQTNCYVISDGERAVIVDPGGGYEKIRAYLDDNKLSLCAVLLTHGHFDHILSLSDFKKDGAKVYIHKGDERMLYNEGNLADDVGLNLDIVIPDVVLNGREKFSIGEMNFEAIHTPGHTKGGCCYVLNGKYLFSGDTLFSESYGRTDFYGGNLNELVDSIKKLFSLEGDMKVFAGHDEPTTLEHERRVNPIRVYFG